jgi:hypothetical protein
MTPEQEYFTSIKQQKAYNQICEQFADRIEYKLSILCMREPSKRRIYEI